jgi:hypothetical protein
VQKGGLMLLDNNSLELTTLLKVLVLWILPMGGPP